MNDKGQINSKELQIQGLLERYLQNNSLNKSVDANESHLDEDSFTAFIEGNLSEREAKPIVSHMAGCSYCRHISAELVKLNAVFADEPHPVVESEPEPTKVSEVLNGVLSRVFGTTEGAVFAHEEKEEKDEESDSEENTSE